MTVTALEWVDALRADFREMVERGVYGSRVSRLRSEGLKSGLSGDEIAAIGQEVVEYIRVNVDHERELDALQRVFNRIYDLAVLDESRGISPRTAIDAIASQIEIMAGALEKAAVMGFMRGDPTRARLDAAVSEAAEWLAALSGESDR